MLSEAIQFLLEYILDCENELSSPKLDYCKIGNQRGNLVKPLYELWGVIEPDKVRDILKLVKPNQMRGMADYPDFR